VLIYGCLERLVIRFKVAGEIRQVLIRDAVAAVHTALDPLDRAVVERAEEAVDVFPTIRPSGVTSKSRPRLPSRDSVLPFGRRWTDPQEKLKNLWW